MIEWQWCSFAQLSAREVYAVLALRSEVFILEQNCIYQDIDGLDVASWHLLGWRAASVNGTDDALCATHVDGRELVAYLRCLPPGLKFAELSLGRVIASPRVRGSGTGRALLAQALKCMQQHYPQQPIRIAAQLYLQEFYQSFGFVSCSAPFDEDGIAHIEMLRPNVAV